MRFSHGPRLKALLAAARPSRDRVSGHRVYGLLRDLDDAKVFMEHHVYAVWDFMSLVKSLQATLTCTTTPWLPTDDALMRRMMNEIVLDEESDDDGRGGYISHFELYQQGMRQVGADTRPIARVVAALARGKAPAKALSAPGVPPSARAFALTTLGIVASRRPHRVAAAFAVGREEIIPTMFRAFVTRVKARFPKETARFAYYLDRHIDVDDDRHRPMALRALETICGNDPRKWAEARTAALASLEARRRLWDGVADAIEARD